MTRPAADLALAARTEAAPDRYEFVTADGCCSPDAFRPAELHLAEALWDRSPERLLVPEANYGVVGTILADVATSVTMTESSARAAARCRENARRNGADATVSLLAELDELRESDGPGTGERRPFDAVAYAPKPYTPIDVGRQRIADALELLAPDGRCYVAAVASAGRSRYRDCLDSLAGDVETVVERDGVAVLAAERPPAKHPASFDPPRYVEPRILEPTVDGVDLELVSVPGLFAAGSLDHGTRLLLETLDVADGDRVLDVCCGYGPIGTYAAATADCSVWLTDDDRVATRCAECSLDRTGVERTDADPIGTDRTGDCTWTDADRTGDCTGTDADRTGATATVVTGDCTGAVADRTFDLVATNPPTHAGSDVLSRLFAEIHRVLTPRGECLFVRHQTLDLSAHLRQFRTVETVATGTEHVVRRAVP